MSLIIFTSVDSQKPKTEPHTSIVCCGVTFLEAWAAACNSCFFFYLCFVWIQWQFKSFRLIHHHHFYKRNTVLHPLWLSRFYLLCVIFQVIYLDISYKTSFPRVPWWSKIPQSFLRVGCFIAPKKNNNKKMKPPKVHPSFLFSFLSLPCIHLSHLTSWECSHFVSSHRRMQAWRFN